MKQPNISSRKDMLDIADNSVTRVLIPGTRKSVKLRWIKPYTMERITRVWIERDLASTKIKDGADILKDLAKEPYFAFKEAALMILNHDLKIRFFYWFYWRWLAFKYNETQMEPIIDAGKKKAPLMAHYEILASSLDMRTDWMKVTKTEAEQYRAELLSAAKLLSAKTSQSTGARGGGSGDGNGTSGIGAS